MSGTTGALAELRREIDEIDHSLHDLLMRRAAVVEDVAATKAQNAAANETPQIIYPAREAEVLRRLHARHAGRLPTATLVQIWREIISASVRLQRPMFVGMADADAAHITAIARDHFGALMSARLFESVASLFEAVATDADLVGVLPAPEQATSDAPWWLHLAPGAAQAPRVVARLPILKGNGDDALVIGSFDPGESSIDVSLFVIESAAVLDASAIADARTLAQSGAGVAPNQRHASLIEIDGSAESARGVAQRLVLDLGDEAASATYVGGNAVQIVGSSEPGAAP